MTTIHRHQQPEATHWSRRIILCLSLFFVITGCSEQKDKSEASVKSEEAVKVTASEGIEISQGPSMKQSVELTRNLTVPPEGSPPVEIKGDDKTLVIQPEAQEGENPAVASMNSSDLKPAEHVKPQSPSMRLEARNQAMADMLRVRKQAEEQGGKAESSK